MGLKDVLNKAKAVAKTVAEKLKTVDGVEVIRKVDNAVQVGKVLNAGKSSKVTKVLGSADVAVGVARTVLKILGKG